MTPEFQNKSSFNWLVLRLIFLCRWPPRSEWLLTPHCPLVVHIVATGAPLLLIHTSTCGGDWNKSELLSGLWPPCNWILPCFTECNKAWHWIEGKYTQHLETNLGRHCSTTNRGRGYCLVSFTDTGAAIKGKTQELQPVRLLWGGEETLCRVSLMNYFTVKCMQLFQMISNSTAFNRALILVRFIGSYRKVDIKITAKFKQMRAKSEAPE